MLGHQLGNLPLALLHLRLEGSGGQAQSPVAQNDHLLQPVGGGHPHPMVSPQVIGRFFNIGVGSFRLLGVHHIDTVDLFHRAWVPLHFIGIKDQNDHTVSKALVVGQDISQRRTGGSHVLLRYPLQLLPGENDVVSVHKQVLRPSLLGTDGVLLVAEAGPRRLFLGLEGPQLHLAIGPLENGLEFLVLLQTSARVGPLSADGRGLSLPWALQP